MSSLTSHPTVAASDANTIEDRGTLRASVVFAGVILVGFGFLYSLGGALAGNVLFPHQAGGSIVTIDGKARGSSLVAQPFVDARYFQPRPSAASYDPMAAAGSNMARSNPDLRKRIDELTQAVAQREGISPAQVPGELVTQSGGGLDPDLSPAGAQVQIARVARERGLDVATVERLVVEHTQGPQFGVLGPPRVNVLALNLALDGLQAKPR